MSNEENTPTEVPTEVPSNEIKIPGDVTIINVNDLKPNSVLAIKINVRTPEEKMLVMPSFMKLLNPYASILREKRVSVVLMAINETINVIPEKEMNASGWFKKDKPLIINPFEK